MDSPRVSAVAFPESYALPSRPADAPDAVQDAHRQTSFVLRNDLRLFEDAMNLQLRILADSSHSSFRTHPYAAMLGLWSRAFLSLADALLLIARGSYQSSVPVVRLICECVAAQRGLLDADQPLFDRWLEGSLRPDDQRKAVDVGLGRYAAAEVIAADERLGSVYRPASELARPAFGATLLQTGPESNSQRLALRFADAAFHLGWAELTLGWLLALAERQLDVAVGAEGVLGISDATRSAHEDLAARVDAALARPDRCRIEEIDEDAGRRFLIHDFRRAPSSSSKKLML